MAGKGIILGLIFVFLTSICQAQPNRVMVPPDMTPKTHSFALPKLQADSSFILSLDSILFDKKCHYMNLITSNPNSSKSMRHFYIHFDKKDSLSYSIQIMLEDTPAKNSIGFFEHNEFLYWFGGEVPPNIIFETKSKRRFSYKEYPLMITDPPIWILMYNSQTGNLEIKETPCEFH